MRYAIVSDIHSNMQAWSSVLLDIRSLNVDEIICLGDIVGYGPNPAQVLASVHANVHHIIMGNHDAVICGKISAFLFNDKAREVILWTKDQLNRDAIDFLKTLPLSLDASVFRCVHGDFAAPASFRYIIDPQDAVPSWKAMEHKLLFAGHTHQPAIFLLGQSGIPRVVEPQDFQLEPEKRFLVNVGSVGQPRDGDPRASYCILDTADWSIHWRRIPFDIDMYRRAVKKAGIPSSASYFLEHDPNIGKPPLRGILNFSPATSPEDDIHDIVEVQELEILQRKAVKWKRLVFLVLLIAFGGLFLMSIFHYQTRPKNMITIDDGVMAPLIAWTAQYDDNILPVPTRSVAEGMPVLSWAISLSDKEAQSVRVDMTKEYGPVFALKSESPSHGMEISSPLIRVRPEMKFCVEALFKMNPGFKGGTTMVISLNKKTGTSEHKIKHFVVKHPNMRRKDDWFLAKHTFTIPANGNAIVLRITGAFAGEVQVRDIILNRKP